MADPVISRILDTVKTRLAAVYSEAGQVIIVREGRPVDARTATIVVQQMAIIRQPSLDRMGNPPPVGYAVPVHVNKFMQIDAQAGETEEEYCERCNLAASEIVELLTIPPAVHWHTMGGNAINTTIGPMKYLPADAGIRPGIVIPLLVTFRVSENDHTEARN